MSIPLIKREDTLEVPVPYNHFKKQIKDPNSASKGGVAHKNNNCSEVNSMIIISEERGCAYCGGLGHRITECPKLEAMQNKQAGNIGRRDYLAPGAADW